LITKQIKNKEKISRLENEITRLTQENQRIQELLDREHALQGKPPIDQKEEQKHNQPDANNVQKEVTVEVNLADIKIDQMKNSMFINTLFINQL
jgi:hypothetical protein